jgi:predicted metal-binding membrane protein
MEMGWWVAMMAAMMLPGAIPAAFGAAKARDRMRTVPLFVGSYLAVWALVSVVVYALYRPHDAVAAAVVVIAAGIYELTPIKRYFRRRCRETVRSGIEFGLCCAGSCIGLMLLLVAIDVMSVAWMAVIGGAIFVQKILPAKAVFDVPFALAIVGLGALIVVAPSAVPGFMPDM